MTKEILLNQFYTDLILVKRDSEQTAITYKISAEEFLNWLVSERIKLKDVSVQNLLYYIIKRKEDGCSELTIAKDISGLRALGEYLERKGMWSENLALEQLVGFIQILLVDIVDIPFGMITVPFVLLHSERGFRPFRSSPIPICTLSEQTPQHIEMHVPCIGIEGMFGIGELD